MLSFGVFSVAQAQEDNSIPDQFNDAIVLADVDIVNIEIKEQNGHEFKIAFDIINNRNVPEAQVMYAVDLNATEQSEEDENVFYTMSIDNKAYPEQLALGANETIHKEISYIAPSAFSGEFMLGMNSAKINGLPLAVNPGVSITLDNLGSGVEIIKKTCLVYVNDEKEGYGLDHGVDINKESESLKVYCDIKNNFSEVQKFIPKFVTKERTSFGNKVNERNLEELELVGGEVRNMSFDIPLAEEPQAYNAELTFYLNDVAVSNTVAAHYVIQGESATVQNIQLDKDYYKKGDIATMKFLFAGQVDAFFEARSLESIEKYQPKNYNFTIILTNNESETCAKDEGSFNESEGGLITKKINIFNNCEDPQAKITLLSSDGKILNEDTFKFESAKTIKAGEKDKKFNLGSMAALIVLVLATGSLILIFIKRKDIFKGVGMILLLFVIMSVGIFMVPGEASAKTLYVHSPWSEVLGIIEKSYVTFSKNVSSIDNCATRYVKVTSSSTVIGCSNGTISVDGYVAGSLVSRATCAGTCSSSGTKNVLASNSVGTRYIGLYAKSWYSTTNSSHCTSNKGSYSGGICTQDTASGSISYTVTACQVCGNEIVEPPSETCDDGASNGINCNPPYGTECWYCSSTCTSVRSVGGYCGDYATDEPQETCDDGAANNGVACNPTYGTECSYCSDTCIDTRVLGGYCGDYATDEPQEACDEGRSGGDTCDSSCQFKYECLGLKPGHSVLCPDADYLTEEDVPISLVESCSGAKCEYICDSYSKYDPVSGTCIPFECTGDAPPNSILCANDDRNLLRDFPKILVPACTDETKCEYVSCTSSYYCRHIKNLNEACSDDDDDDCDEECLDGESCQGTKRTKNREACYNYCGAFEPDTSKCLPEVCKTGKENTKDCRCEPGPPPGSDQNISNWIEVPAN